MRKLICIICPNGCELSIDDNNNVTGNTCNRGKDFALQEIKEPKRTISSTIKTIFKDYPVVSVKVDNEIPKDKIFDVIKEINKVKIDDQFFDDFFTDE